MKKVKINLILFFVICSIFFACKKNTQAGKINDKNYYLLRTVQNVTEENPLTYKEFDRDERLIVLSLNDTEIIRIPRVSKIESVGTRLFISYIVPSNKMSLYQTQKLYCIECTSGKIWAFEDEFTSFFADDELIILIKQNDRIEDNFYVDVFSATDFTQISKENLFSKIESFPSDRIFSELKNSEDILELSYSDEWMEVFARFTFEKSSGTWKSQKCNYSKDFWYIPSDAIFCEAVKNKIYNEQKTEYLYKSNATELCKKLHYVNLEKNIDKIISLKKITEKNKNFVDFDFVTFEYPECELLFYDETGLQYYIKLNLNTTNYSVHPANRYKKHDFSKYPGLH